MFKSIFRGIGKAVGVGSGKSGAADRARDLYQNDMPYYDEGLALDPNNYILGDTELAGVTVDPAVKAAQMQALERMQQLQDGGLSDADRAGLNAVSDEANRVEKGRQDAIMQRAQAMGLGGSGMELANQMLSAQGAANRSAAAGRDIARMAQDRALQAMQNTFNMGSGLRSQQYGEDRNLATARDQISEFNLRNRQGLDRDAVQRKDSNVDLRRTDLGSVAKTYYDTGAAQDEQSKFGRDLFADALKGAASIWGPK